MGSVSDTGEVFSVTYRPRADASLRVARYGVWRPVEQVWRVLIILVAALVLSLISMALSEFLLEYLNSKFGDYLGGNIVNLLIFIVIFLFLYFCLKRFARLISVSVSDGMKASPGDIRLMASVDGISTVSEFGSAIFPWSIIRQIVVSEEDVLIYVSRLGANVIPNSAFSSQEELDRFLSYVQRMSGRKVTKTSALQRRFGLRFF
jgi:hypothetical protein